MSFLRDAICVVFITIVSCQSAAANRDVKRQVHGHQTTPAPSNTDPMATWLHRASSHKPNVLFLVADDLRPKLGCYGDENMVTPNLDHLASMSVRFDRAYAQQAICGPSRTSFMTGRRPDTTRVYNLDDYWRTVGGNFTTLPQYFKNHGYVTADFGKIFHPGTSSGGTDDFPYSWSQKVDHGKQTLHTADRHSAAIQDVEETGGVLSDTDVANKAASWLHRHAQHGNQPFFLAVGFHKPHLPWLYPRKYKSLYPLSKIHLAPHRHWPTNVPDYTLTTFSELRSFNDVAALNLTGPDYYIPEDYQLKLRQAYSGAVSYMDALVGKVLQALSDNNYNRNTIVTFHGDHGWQLGENGEWAKHTNFDMAARIPMMVHVPAVTSASHDFRYIDALDADDMQHAPALHLGSYHSTSELVEAVDLFPTLSELAGLPVPRTCPQDSRHVLTCNEGTSLVPLIRAVRDKALGSAANYTVQWKDAAYSQYPRGGHNVPIMGYTMKTAKYRYTEWVSFDKSTATPDFSQVHGRELYDHTVDPDEAHNLAGDSNHGSLRQQLATKLHGGWRQTLQEFVSNNPQL